MQKQNLHKTEQWTPTKLHLIETQNKTQTQSQFNKKKDNLKINT